MHYTTVLSRNSMRYFFNCASFHLTRPCCINWAQLTPFLLFRLLARHDDLSKMTWKRSEVSTKSTFMKWNNDARVYFFNNIVLNVALEPSNIEFYNFVIGKFDDKSVWWFWTSLWWFMEWSVVTSKRNKSIINLTETGNTSVYSSPIFNFF